MTYWAYVYPDDLCKLAVAAPGIDVLTRDETLADDLASTCSDATANVVVK
jgi:hypothetical protein